MSRRRAQLSMKGQVDTPMIRADVCLSFIKNKSNWRVPGSTSDPEKKYKEIRDVEITLDYAAHALLLQKDGSRIVIKLDPNSLVFSGDTQQDGVHIMSSVHLSLRYDLLEEPLNKEFLVRGEDYHLYSILLFFSNVKRTLSFSDELLRFLMLHNVRSTDLSKEEYDEFKGSMKLPAMWSKSVTVLHTT